MMDAMACLPVGRDDETVIFVVEQKTPHLISAEAIQL